MSGIVLSFPRPSPAHVAQDRYFALALAFAAQPAPALMPVVEAAYRAFYVALVGSADGIEAAVAELQRRMAERQGRPA